MQFRLTPDQTLMLLMYLVMDDYESGVALASDFAGVDFESLDSDEQSPYLEKVVETAEAARQLEYMPKIREGKVRLFHSILKMGGMSIHDKLVEVLTEGLMLSYSKEYQSQFGSFAGIWTQSDCPYNTNTVWVAFDVPESKIDHWDLRDYKDSRRTQPLQVVYGYDVKPSEIVAVQGLPVSKVKQAVLG